MTKKANLIAGLTFVTGLATFQMYASRLRAEVSGGTPVDVLIVTEDLAPGSTLTKGNLASTRIPADYVDGRRVLLADKAKVLGVQIQEELEAGQGVVWSDMIDGAAHKHLAALVTTGRRAYTIDSEANPLGRLLRVADRVDVLVETKGKTATLLQRVRVLAVGGQLERDDSLLGEKTIVGTGVTLSVTPEQARKLLEAEARGDLRLILRNPGDEHREGEQHSASDGPTHKARSAEKKEIEHVR